MGITETKLKKSDNEEAIKIEGYKAVRFDCEEIRVGGGCLLYYKDHLKICQITPETLEERDTAEAVWVELTHQSQKLIIGVLYRPPDDTKFYDSLQKNIEAVWNGRKNLLLMGNLNSDVTIRPGGTAPKGKQLLSMLRRSGFKNMIKNPTRTTQTSETILDLIITSNEDLILNSGTFDTGIADHSLIFATLKIRKDRVPPRYQNVSNTSKCDWASFTNSLEKVPWHVCDIFEDNDDSVWAWNQLYNNVRKD